MDKGYLIGGAWLIFCAALMTWPSTYARLVSRGRRGGRS